MAISVPKLQAYMEAGLNVLITGPAGTGKTSMLKQASANLGWTMKYYSVSTLDPFADLVGIPVPDKDTRTVDYYRPREVDQAHVIFLDELNRASDPKTLNAVFELIQFRSINGEKLPNLKCVVAAINPVADGYDTEELDLALLDRFDLYLEAPVEINPVYFKNVFGTAYAKAGVQLFTDYQDSYKDPKRSGKNALGYLSPRRMEKVMDIFKKFPDAATISATLPPDVTVSTKQWARVFQEALQGVPTPAPAAGAAADAQGMEAEVRRQLRLTASELRSKANNQAFLRAYDYTVDNGTQADVQKLLNALASALNKRVGTDTVRALWTKPVSAFNPSQQTMMMDGWNRYKRDEMLELFRQLGMR